MGLEERDTPKMPCPPAGLCTWAASPCQWAETTLGGRQAPRICRGDWSAMAAGARPVLPASALCLICGEQAGQLSAGADAELGVGLVQVVADGPRRQEPLRTDVAVGQPAPGELDHLELLRGEQGEHTRLPGRAACRSGADRGQLLGGAPRPAGRTQVFECLVRGSQLRAGLAAAAVAAQPLPVQQAGPGLLERPPLVIAVGGGAVMPLGVGVVADQGPAAVRYRARPRLARKVQPGLEPGECLMGVV